MNRLATIALLFAAGCTTEAVSTNDVGVTYRIVEDGLIAGTFVTAYGSVEFTSAVTSDGVVDVTFDRGGGAFGSHVDWVSLTNDLVAADDFVVSADDRFVMKALASTLENDDLGAAGHASDNLIRQANLWGHHPEGAVLERHIVADAERGWTKLCNVGAYTFSHDATTHGLQSEYLSAGRYETSNPCRDRCGPGCNGVGTSAWTRDCGNHDRCEQLHTSTSCADEFASASDDFTFAGNCAY